MAQRCGSLKPTLSASPTAAVGQKALALAKRSYSTAYTFRLTIVKKLDNWPAAKWKNFSHALRLSGLCISIINSWLFLRVRSPNAYPIEICRAPNPDLLSVIGDYTREQRRTPRYSLQLGNKPYGAWLTTLGFLLKQTEMAVYIMVFR